MRRIYKRFEPYLAVLALFLIMFGAYAFQAITERNSELDDTMHNLIIAGGQACTCPICGEHFGH